MKEIELIKKNLKQIIALVEKVGFDAYNFDLEDFTSTLENYLDELNDMDDFEVFSDEIDEGFIRMNQLAGVITEGKAKKMMKNLNEDEDFEIISKNTKKSPFEDKEYDNYCRFQKIMRYKNEYKK